MKPCLKRFVAFIVLTIVFFPPVALVAETAATRPSETLRVGVIIPLSGDAASYGQTFKNSMQLALDDLTPAVREKIEVTFEDDQLLPKNSVTALNKLLAGGGVDVAFAFSSSTANAIVPITEERKITLLAIASDPAVSRGRRYAFNFWMKPETASAVLLKEMQRRGIRKIARIGAIHDGVLAYYHALDAAANGSVEVVLEEGFPPDARDFRSFVTKLRSRASDIDGVMVLLFPGQLHIFAKQFHQAGLRTELFGVETFEDANEVKLSNGTLVGRWYVNTDEEDPAFISRYQSKFPGSSTYAAASGYDAIRILGAAIEQNVPRSEISDYLRALKDYKGALGTYSGTGDQRFSMPAAVKVVTESGFKKLN